MEQQPNSPQRGFYPEFRDRVEAHRQSRGAVNAQWEDVWIVAAQTSETSRILRDQGVSSQTLVRDVRFSLVYGRPESTFPTDNPFFDVPTAHREAANQLMEDLGDYRETRLVQSTPEGEEAGKKMMSRLRKYMRSRDILLSDPDMVKKQEAKAIVLMESIKGFLTEMGLSSDRYGGGRDTLPSSYEHEQTAQVIDSLREYILHKSSVITDAKDPLRTLDEQSKTGIPGLEIMSPFQLVEFAKALADPFIEYTLFRNGLAAPKEYQSPFKMPNHAIIETALDGYNYVKDIRETDVSFKHLVPSLLLDSEVLTVIRDLDKSKKITSRDEAEDDDDGFAFFMGGGRRRNTGPNFIKFNKAVRRAITPEDDTEERFFHHPVIADELKKFLYDVSEKVSTGPQEFARARLFAELVKVPEVEDVLVAAGLTKTEIKRLPSVLKTLENKFKDDQKVGEKRKEPFKVDDRELVQLLEKYASDRTKLALDGKLDPVIGRNEELRQMLQILLQRDRSNPLLLGEPGVGKTALFDGLAQAIASGKVPKELVGAKVYNLNLHAMNSNAMYRGQFEGRLMPVINGVAERNERGDKPPIILCIDELHSAITAGTAEGTSGAGEILKPALTEGNLIIVGATTQRDFSKGIEKDQALVRRFQTIFVDQPSPDVAKQILGGLSDIYAKHHRVEIPDTVLPLLVDMTNRYLPVDMQPDKSITALDEACTRARMAGRDKLTKDDVLDTIGAKAKIDPDFLKTSEGSRFLKLRTQLPRRVLGQPEATKSVAETLIAAKADLRDPNQPLGRFLFLGPTGVGKTETARALAELLHGTEDALIKIDMSEYKDKHTVSRFVGAPPGYIGHGEEGKLVGEIRRRPHSIVLLDEVEKAHPEVMDVFLSILEDGQITDARGLPANFRNSVIIMTSNIGSAEASRTSFGFAGKKGNEQEVEDRRRETFEKEMKDFFRPEFLNRLDEWFIFNTLNRDTIRQLVQREIKVISSRLEDRWGHPLNVEKVVLDKLVEDGYKVEYGARQLKRTVQNQLAQPLAIWMLGNDGKLPADRTVLVDSIDPKFSADVI